MVCLNVSLSCTDNDIVSVEYWRGLEMWVMGCSRSLKIAPIVDHVDYVLKICSQRIYLLKQLRDQGLPLQKLHTVFQAIVLSRLMYALPAWGPLLNVKLVHKIDGFLKRSFHYGFTNKLTSNVDHF